MIKKTALMVMLGAVFLLLPLVNILSDDISVSVTAVVPSPGSTPPPSSGGGGGGGGVPTIPPATSVTFAGRAYPLSRVSILKDGQLAITTIAGPDANFYVALTGLAAGSYNFAVYSEDQKNIRSATFTFPINITAGAITNISGIFIAPTIALDKSTVKKGDDIAIFGQTVPQGVLTITVHSDQEHIVTAQADSNGVYLYNFDTSPLELGAHEAQSKTRLQQAVSSQSQIISFSVGTSNTPRDVVGEKKADLSGDARINIVDFSILAYWYRQPNPPSNIDQNGDGKVDLVDFSILAYYWTG